MKKSIRFAAIVATLVAVASLSTAVNAQGISQFVSVNVPFAFEYGNAHFAAGSYTIEARNSYTMLLRGEGKGAVAMVRSEYGKRQVSTGKVIFGRSGDRYFLNDVWIPGSGMRLSVYAGQAQKRAVKEALSRGAAPTTVAIDALPTTGATAGN